MSQAEVAAILMVSNDTVTGWELNRQTPTAKMARKIIEYLEYVPFETAKASLADRLCNARMICGLTQRQVATYLECDESNLRLIELGKRIPGKRMLEKILHFIATPV